MKKKINYMGLSELMRMIIIFVTFCLNLKKKSPPKNKQKIKNKNNTTKNKFKYPLL